MIKVNKSEKERILEMHNNARKPLIVEQTTKADLENIVIAIPNGQVVKMGGQSPYDWAIKQVSQRGSGAIRYYYIDGSYTQKEKDGRKSQGSWDVNEYKQKADDKRRQTQQIAQPTKDDIERLKKEQGYMERSEISDYDEAVNDPKRYQKHPTYQLWKRVGQAVTSGINPRQEKIINRLKELGYIVNPSDDEIAKGDLEEIEPNEISSKIPGWEQAFPKGTLKVYISGETAKELGKQIGTEVSTQAESENDCIKLINDFYTASTRKTRVSPSEVKGAKTRVESCQSQFKPKWAKGKFLGMGKGNKDMINKLNLLSGYISTFENEQAPPRNSPYRIEKHLPGPND